MNSYAIGNLVRVSVVFANSADAAVDPDVVGVQVRNPAGTVTALAYGPDAEVVKASTGHYYLDVDADEPGEWLYRWYSMGTGQAAAEGAFTVEASVFTEVEPT
jgi:hypothetical protein